MLGLKVQVLRGVLLYTGVNIIWKMNLFVNFVEKNVKMRIRREITKDYVKKIQINKILIL